MEHHEEECMQNTWVTHLPHFLDEQGNIPNDLPVPARRLVKAICDFITYATHFDREDNKLPQCFVTIKRKHCVGTVVPLVSSGDDTIDWYCQSCGSRGSISGWRHTLWDLSERHELH
jgi:hypothetical protein